MSSLLLVLLCAMPVGVVVGLISGLLGIGGGLILVPVFYILLVFVGVPPEMLMPMALGSSLAAIIVTSCASCLAHHRLGNVPWSIIPMLLAGLATGSLIAGYLAHHIPVWLLEAGFACFAAVMSMRMWRQRKQMQVNETKVMTPWSTLSATTAIGAFSALLGIAGGTLLVPYLSERGQQMTRAIGASSCCGIIVAAAGALGYVLSGWRVTGLPDWSLGYVYLPLVVGVVVTALFSAPIGAKLASRWPTQRLKRIVAVLLLLVALKLILF
ncbi:sulfite exporter TauE/SafE family protein [Corallincola platygyrae]|uniref:Probable membrane transporter protein n=1 Tax=Corallincola platygyrae TaxID=1193278 RepID=A0ABW4XRW2_9GAMM